jgi:ribulose-bisphosphate carboxylase small chain
MSAIAQQAQVAKTVAVSTGKVANAKSMMVWRPHGNKYVRDRDFDSPTTTTRVFSYPPAGKLAG